MDKSLSAYIHVRCGWVMDCEGEYDTGCGNKHYFPTGDIVENKHKYCPYCGSKIIDDTKYYNR